ncbi:MAG: hypothetical protein KDA89_21210 [Planctomycetaceae bacterium]|nr:hypothetical protein [Planctomycetaceae bacterium]
MATVLEEESEIHFEERQKGSLSSATGGTVRQPAKWVKTCFSTPQTCRVLRFFGPAALLQKEFSESSAQVLG